MARAGSSASAGGASSTGAAPYGPSADGKGSALCDTDAEAQQVYGSELFNNSASH